MLLLVMTVAIGFMILFILLPRYGPHYTSRLTCQNCKRAFNYHWVPGATLTSLRYGNSRRLRCPYCNQPAKYNIAKTRVTKPIQQQKQKN